MTIDNYEKAKQHFVTEGLGERAPGHIDDVREALRETEIQEEANPLIVRYRDRPEVLKAALAAILPKNTNNRRDDTGSSEDGLHATIAPTHGLWMA
jgi:hypothetical protein